MKKILSIMNFARGVEPRYPADLYGTVAEQLRLLDENGLIGTFLLQYDAFILPQYAELLRDTRHELGLWLEVVRPLVEKVGIKWRGREGFSWDWHCHCGMTIGYTPDERIRIIDEAFSRFRAVFGFYPKSVGSWVLDEFSIAYMDEKYGIDAACVCKEQWGTDGYTLFGGYYNHAYYPSKNNMLCPAQTAECQINVPVFRLLSNDPIHQYDCMHRFRQSVFTLEPYDWKMEQAGGAYPDWVDWYFRNNYSENRGLRFSYAQVGQENSFSWEGMERGYRYQIDKVRKLRDSEKIDVMTVGDAGRWFKRTFEISPALTYAALDDWSEKNMKSVWYYCRNYRMNLVIERDLFRLRDVFLFDEKYVSRYRDKVCETPHCTYDCLPVVNGLVWSTKEIRGGLIFADDAGNALIPSAVDYAEGDGEVTVTVTATNGSRVRVTANERGITLSGDAFRLRPEHPTPLSDEAFAVTDGKTASFEKNGYRYAVRLKSGSFSDKTILTENGVISADFSDKSPNM